MSTSALSFDCLERRRSNMCKMVDSSTGRLSCISIQAGLDSSTRGAMLDKNPSVRAARFCKSPEGQPRRFLPIVDRICVRADFVHRFFGAFA